MKIDLMVTWNRSTSHLVKMVIGGKIKGALLIESDV